MKKNELITGVLLLLCGIQLLQSPVKTADYALLTVEVKDLYGSLIDDAQVSVDYVYLQDDDTAILDQFTEKGIASFNLESEREYIVTVTKAGFVSHTETVDLEEDTKVAVILEYAQNVPVIHMVKYVVSPPEVAPGDKFQLQLVMENEGTGDALGVKVTVTPTEYFSPVQPSSSAYFERLDRTRAVSFVLTFAVSGEAPSGVYDLALTITYEDAQGLSYTVEESVGIPILRVPLVRLLNVDYSQEVTQGESFTFSADIANMGRFTVDGLHLEVESDMDWEYFSYYIGSLEAGDFDTFTSQVSSQTAGEHTFLIRVGYVDDFNKEHVQEQSFSVVVKEGEKATPSPPQEGLWDKIIKFLKSLLGWDACAIL